MTAWVLVADSSRATLFSVDKALSPLHEIESFSHPASRVKTQDLTSDRQGRTGANQHMMDYDIDPKRQEAMIFAKELSQCLKTGRHRGHFDKLYIAAPPGFLGLLRNKLDSATTHLVVGEIDKDLTRFGPTEIRRHLPERL